MNENEREMERRASISQLTQMRSVTGGSYTYTGTGVQSTVGGTTTELRVLQLHTTYSLLELEHYRVL